MAYMASIESEPAPLVIPVPEMAEDAATRFRTMQFIGSLAINGWDKIEQLPGQKFKSLHEALQAAAEGDEDGRQMVEANVSSDVIERTIKSGMIMEVEQAVNDQGYIIQHGQPMEAVQANSLRFSSPEMMPRVEAEARNSFRIKHLLQSGRLNEYVFVVFSRAADNMDIEQMDDEGFFTQNMSCAIQATDIRGGTLVTESGFVAGVKAPGQERHDEQTIIKLGQKLKVDLSNKTAAELIDTPLLIHKSLMPNGVLDLVEMYDEAAGSTFFGEDRPAEDYVAYKQKCLKRQQAFQPRVKQIVNKLIAKAPYIKNEIEATQRLHKLSEAAMVEHAIHTDKNIDPMVFGYASAVCIQQARQAAEHSDYLAVQHFLNSAKTLARSSSCPGAGKSNEIYSDGLDTDQDENEDNGTLEDCEFTSKECPKCHKKNVKTWAIKGVFYGACGCNSASSGKATPKLALAA